jgi:hypothetical protein
VEARSEAGQDEQGVVDPDTQADHDRQRRPEDGYVDEHAEKWNRRQSDTQTDQGGGQGEAHGDHRAEGQQQHDDRSGQADRFPSTSLRGRRELHRLAAHLDLERVAVRTFGRRQHLLHGAGGDVQRRAGEADAGEGDRAVPGDLERTERSVRAHHLRDAWVTLYFGEELLHAADDGRIVHCRLGAEHDLCARTGLLGKPVEQQVQGSLRLRGGRLEAARQGTTESRPAPGDEHERGQPPHDHEPALPVAPSRQATQHGDPPSPQTTLNCTLDAMSKRRS